MSPKTKVPSAEVEERGLKNNCQGFALNVDCGSEEMSRAVANALRFAAVHVPTAGLTDPVVKLIGKHGSEMCGLPPEVMERTLAMLPLDASMEEGEVIDASIENPRPDPIPITADDLGIRSFHDPKTNDPIVVGHVPGLSAVHVSATVSHLSVSTAKKLPTCFNPMLNARVLPGGGTRSLLVFEARYGSDGRETLAAAAQALIRRLEKDWASVSVTTETSEASSDAYMEKGTVHGVPNPNHGELNLIQAHARKACPDVLSLGFDINTVATTGPVLRIQLTRKVPADDDDDDQAASESWADADEGASGPRIADVLARAAASAADLLREVVRAGLTTK